MRQPVFTGVCTALVTPFTAEGAVHYPKLAQLIETQIAAGVDALCICGTTGEAPTLSTREHLACIEFCVRQADHRVKVVAGAGSNDTAKALCLSRRAQDLGADALLLVTPYYNKTTQAGLAAHYLHIADRVDLPIILYNVPGRTGLSLTADTYQLLSRHPRINGVKEAGGDLSLAAHTLALCGEDFSLWSGNDDQVVPLMALGARGVISVASNLVPERMVRMVRLCEQGRGAEAAALQRSLLPLTDALFSEVNPIPIKTAMNLLGQEVGPLRLPLVPMSPAHQESLRSVLEAMELLPA